MQEIYKAILGQGGALVLACLVLYQVMSMYDKLIQDMIQDQKEDRAMYIQTMSDLTKQIDNLQISIQQIQKDVSDIRKQQGKD